MESQWDEIHFMITPRVPLNWNWLTSNALKLRWHWEFDGEWNVDGECICVSAFHYNGKMFKWEASMSSELLCHAFPSIFLGVVTWPFRFKTIWTMIGQNASYFLSLPVLSQQDTLSWLRGYNSAQHCAVLLLLNLPCRGCKMLTLK